MPSYPTPTFLFLFLRLFFLNKKVFKKRVLKKVITKPLYQNFSFKVLLTVRDILFFINRHSFRSICILREGGPVQEMNEHWLLPCSQRHTQNFIHL